MLAKSRSKYAANTMLAQVMTALNREADAAINELGRMVQAGELDLDAMANGNQDLFIDAAITPKGLRKMGYGAPRDSQEKT